MSEKTSSKIGSINSSLFYFKQKKVNWKYSSSIKYFDRFPANYNFKFEDLTINNFVFLKESSPIKIEIIKKITESSFISNSFFYEIRYRSLIKDNAGTLFRFLEYSKFSNVVFEKILNLKVSLIEQIFIFPFKTEEINPFKKNENYLAIENIAYPFKTKQEYKVNASVVFEDFFCTLKYQDKEQKYYFLKQSSKISTLPLFSESFSFTKEEYFFNKKSICDHKEKSDLKRCSLKSESFNTPESFLPYDNLKFTVFSLHETSFL